MPIVPMPNGDIIELFRHERIDLVERAGGNTEALSAEDILNISLSVDHCLPVSQYHGRVPVVDIENDRSNLGMALGQLPHKGIAGGKHGICQDQGHHDLLCGAGDANLHIAEQADVHIFIVDMNPEGRQKGEDRLDDPIRLDVLDQTGLDWNHFVRTLFINPAGRLSFSVGCKNRGHFVTVMIRCLHTDELVGNNKFSDQVIEDLLLAPDLLVIGHIDH